MAKVRLENISKKFGKRQALQEINFEVGDKELFCIMGYPGAGKTTTLRIIAGLVQPDTGNVYVDDKKITTTYAGDRNIAMIFQNLALYPTRTVLENIAFPLHILKLAEDEVRKRVTEVAKTLQIDHLLTRTLATLSGGERQRVAIGRALVRRPSVFLMDEPLTNLDALLRLNMRVELKRLQREIGQTIIYATPDQLEAMTIADRVLVLRDGGIQQLGQPDEVYLKPSNRYVASLFGSPSMNFLPCSLIAGNAQTHLDCGAFKLDVSRYKEILTAAAGTSGFVLGVRPEATTVEPKQSPSSTGRFRVSLVEPIGNELILHLDGDGVTIKALTSASSHFKPSDEAWLTIDTDRIHVFDSKTEKTIL